MSTPSPALHALRFGKIADEPIDVYHASDVISKTKLDLFRQSPRLYAKMHVFRTLPKSSPTDAMLIGNAVDAWAVEGEAAFNARFTVAPEDAPRRPSERQINAKKPSPETLMAIGFWNAFDATAAGKSVLGAEAMNVVRRCVDALASNPLWVEMRAAAQTQMTFRVKGDLMSMQCRPDLWLEEGCAATKGEACIVDLKTIAELPADEPDSLSRHIANYGYHRAAHVYRELVATVMGYRDGWRPAFYLAFVEKVEPHAVVIRKVDDEALAVGERETAEAIARLMECHRTGVWPDSWDTPMSPIGLPVYYVRRVMASEGIF